MKRASYKQDFTEEIRKKQSGEIIENYDETIPIIVEKCNKSKLKEFDRKR